MSRPPLFIHIPKTAGTSIGESGLVVRTSAKGLKADIIKRIELDPRSPYKIYMWFGKRVEKHIPYTYLDHDYLNRFDRVFTVVRNPWARLVSFYNHLEELNKDPNWTKYMKPTWYHQEKISWEEYLNRMDSFIMTPNYYWQHPYDHWALQSDWLPNKGKMDILRYENLHDDLSNYLGRPIILPCENKSKEVDYRTYYTEEQKQKVANWFRLDIERWGFDFDSGATKNYWAS